MMDLLDWQGSSADAEKLLGLLHKQGLEAALYSARRPRSQCLPIPKAPIFCKSHIP